MHNTDRHAAAPPPATPLIRWLKVAGGVAAGTLFGRVLGGNWRATILGGALGAVAGVTISGRRLDLPLPGNGHMMLTMRWWRPTGRPSPLGRRRRRLAEQVREEAA